jgi:hypothetical protein
VPDDGRHVASCDEQLDAPVRPDNELPEAFCRTRVNRRSERRADASPLRLHHVLDRAGRNESSGTQNRHAIAHALDFRKNVRRKKHRGAVGSRVPDDVVERPLNQRVEPLGWFIEEYEARTALERLHQSQLLLHAVGVRPYRTAKLGCAKPEPLEENVAIHRDLPGQRFEKRECSQTSEIRPQGQLAGKVANCGSDGGAGCPDGTSQDFCRARTGLQQSQQHADCRCLSCAIRPEKPEDFAWLHAEIEALDRRHRTVMFSQRRGDDRGSHDTVRSAADA